MPKLAYCEANRRLGNVFLEYNNRNHTPVLPRILKIKLWIICLIFKAKKKKKKVKLQLPRDLPGAEFQGLLYCRLTSAWILYASEGQHSFL